MPAFAARAAGGAHCRRRRARKRGGGGRKGRGKGRGGRGRKMTRQRGWMTRPRDDEPRPDRETMTRPRDEQSSSRASPRVVYEIRTALLALAPRGYASHGLCPSAARASCVALSAAATDTYPPGSTRCAAAADRRRETRQSHDPHPRSVQRPLHGHVQRRHTPVRCTVPPSPGSVPWTTHGNLRGGGARDAPRRDPPPPATRTRVSATSVANASSADPAAAAVAAISSMGTPGGSSLTSRTAADPDGIERS